MKRWILLAAICLIPAVASGQQPIPIIHPNPGGSGATVVSDNVTIRGNGASAANPLAIKAVQVDGSTITGTGAVGSPLTAPGSGLLSGIGGTKGNSPGADGVFNVKNFGAKCDNATDDSAAINAAVQAACAAANATYYTAPSVYFPDGTCIVHSPIIDNCTYPITLWGDSSSAAVISTGGYRVPNIYIEPPGYVSTLGTVACPSLATGAGQSLCWTSSQEYFYALGDTMTTLNPGGGLNKWGQPTPLNGLSAYTIQVYVQYNGATGGGVNGQKYYVLAGAGRGDLTTGAVLNNAVEIYWTQTNSTNGTVTGCFTTSTSGYKCATSAALVNGTAYYVLLEYDGANVSLATGTLGGATTTVQTAATGTIVQPPGQSFMLGNYPASGGYQFNAAGSGCCTGGGFNTSHWIGSIDSLRMEELAVSIPATAPNTKFGTGGGPLGGPDLVINGKAFNDAFLTIDTAYGGSQGQIPARYDGAPLVAGNSSHVVKGLKLMGPGNYGILGISTLNMTIENVTAQGSEASIQGWRESYGWTIHNVTLSSGGRGGLELINRSGIVSLDGLANTSSYYGLVLWDSGGRFDDVFFTAGGAAKVGIWTSNAGDIYGGSTFRNFAADVENGGTYIPLVIGGSDAVTFITPGVTTNTGNCTTPAVIVNTSNGSGTLTSLDFVGGVVAMCNTSPEIVDIIDSSNMANPVTWTSGYLNAGVGSSGPLAAETSVPISNKLGQVVILPTGNHAVAVSALPTPMIPGQIYNINDWNGTSVGTTCVGGGSAYHKAVWNGSNWIC